MKRHGRRKSVCGEGRRTKLGEEEEGLWHPPKAHRFLLHNPGNAEKGRNLHLLEKPLGPRLRRTVEHDGIALHPLADLVHRPAQDRYPFLLHPKLDESLPLRLEDAEQVRPTGVELTLVHLRANVQNPGAQEIGTDGILACPGPGPSHVLAVGVGAVAVPHDPGHKVEDADPIHALAPLVPVPVPVHILLQGIKGAVGEGIEDIVHRDVEVIEAIGAVAGIRGDTLHNLKCDVHRLVVAPAQETSGDRRLSLNANGAAAARPVARGILVPVKILV